MGEYKITLTETEEKALLTDMTDIQGWLENAIKNKSRQCIDTIVGQLSDKQASKMSLEDKVIIVQEAVIETAAEKQVRLREETRKLGG